MQPENAKQRLELSMLSVQSQTGMLSAINIANKPCNQFKCH